MDLTDAATLGSRSATTPGAILVPLADMPAGLRYAVQFCPACEKHGAGLDYLVCRQHQARGPDEAPSLGAEVNGDPA